MNRIHPESALIDPMLSVSGLVVGELAHGPAVSGRGPYAIFGPLHYEPNYAYPLLIWLHGPGEDEQQLRRIMPSISLRNYVAVAPRGTVVAPTAVTPSAVAPAAAITSGIAPAVNAPAADRQCEPRAGTSTGHGWRQTEGHIQAAELRVLECLDTTAEKFHVAPDRCFIAGYGCGGTMAFRIALRNPQRFAGVLSLSGPFPSGRSPLAQLHHVRRLEFFIACSRASSLYPTEKVCRDLRLLHTAGMSVVLREYPGDDALSAQMLSDMDRWLMEQVTGCRAERLGVSGQGGG